MKKINEIFEIEPVEVTPIENIEVLVGEEENLSEEEVAKRALFKLLETGDKALFGALNVASQSDSPRAYEVVATLMSAISNAAKTLVDNKVSIEKVRTKKSSGTVHNNLFVGTTRDLMKLLNNPPDDTRSEHSTETT